MADKFSAYLSIYNDWDILPSALRSVAPYVDELVVVDGAYDWMVPYLTILGIDPVRSDPRVYAAIESSGIPFRVISRTWKNEIQKRQTGYEACAREYVCRVDADEVLFFNDAALEGALSRGMAVGAMEMPNYVAPGWISCAKETQGIERQCFLFDRKKVSSEIHLNYLWLVLTADTLPQAGNRPFQVEPEPLAFNAHLNAWRTPQTSTSRAAFYILNWMRQHGVPWLPELQNRPLTSIGDLFATIPPPVFLSSLSMTQIALGMIEASDRRTFRRSPLSIAQEAIFSDLYEVFLRSLAARNEQLTVQERDFLTSIPILLDLSTTTARKAIAPDGTITLRMSMALNSAQVRLITYAATEPQCEVQNLDVRISGRDLEIGLPALTTTERSMLRQCLTVQVWSNVKELPQRFRALV